MTRLTVDEKRDRVRKRLENKKARELEQKPEQKRVEAVTPVAAYLHERLRSAKLSGLEFELDLPIQCARTAWVNFLNALSTELEEMIGQTKDAE